MNIKKIKVMVIDDSLIFRSFLANSIKEDDEIEVVGTAMDGRAAINTIPLVNPDVVTLDIEMPRMDGIATLKEIKSKHPSIQVIMVSSHTSEGADITLKAMELGASDFILKTDTSDMDFETRKSELKKLLIAKIKRTHKTVQFNTQIKSVGAVFEQKKKMLNSAMNLILPGSKPMFLFIGCEERHLGHLLLFMRHLKSAINVPAFFKIMVPDIFLTSLIKSFERSNPNFEYLAIKDVNEIKLRKKSIYLLGEKDRVIFSNVKKDTKVEKKITKIRFPLDEYFKDLSDSKIPNTPVFLIGDDMKSDGIIGIQKLTQNGVPTVFITKNVRYFLEKENELANRVIDINLIANFIHNLFQL